MMPLKSISLYDAIKRQKELQKNVNNNDNVFITSKSKRNVSVNTTSNNHNVSKMYYDANFQLGEDLHSNTKQEEEWKNTNIDGRKHISHR